MPKKQQAHNSGPTIAFGPKMPAWGSWEWVGADLASALGLRASTFAGWEEPDADVVVVVKHGPPPDWAERIATRSTLVYCPIDRYGALEEIAQDAVFLRRCARIIVHCKRLAPLLSPYAPTVYLDHHLKYAAPLRREFRSRGNILWVGVRSNLPAVVDWINAHPLPAPLEVLTNPEEPDKPLDPVMMGFKRTSEVHIQVWTADLQRRMTAEARAAFDIKDNDFRSRHKPAAKAIDFIASGVPLALNPGSSPAEHLAELGLPIASPLDVDRWLSRDYWKQTRKLGAQLRKELGINPVVRRFQKIIEEAIAGKSARSVQMGTESSAASGIDGGSATATEPGSKLKSGSQASTRVQSSHRAKTTAASGIQVYGLLITKDDHHVFADWCRDQLGLYDAVVCLDGSESGETAQLAKTFGDKLIYLRERDFDIPHKTDHGLRRVVHRQIIKRFGVGHWIMCCHTDEFCYHDPRKIAQRAQQERFDLVSWFSPHFYPHPEELSDWPNLSHRPVPDRFRHYHWSYKGDELPWLEDRLYRALPGVTWDDATHGNVRPHGIKKPAPFHPIFRHFKVIAADPAWYEQEQACAHYKHHWQGLEHRTGLPFPVRRFEDLFVTEVPNYARSDRFDDNFPHSWNIGDEFRPNLASRSAPLDQRREQLRRASDFATTGNRAEARRLLGELDVEGVHASLRALALNNLAAIAAMEGETERARIGFGAALAGDPDCQSAKSNLALLDAETTNCVRTAVALTNGAGSTPVSKPIRVAIVSFLFNWPSTGGGIVHTVELARFLGEAGYDVMHFYVRHVPWSIGAVTEPLPFDNRELLFNDSTWNVPAIQQRINEAVGAFDPDQVILTDSWNFKPLLAEAVRDFPYILRLQALECLCPLNNVRLLPEPGGRVRQCPFQQLASPEQCKRCLAERGHQSGSLHQAERALCGVGTPEYHQKLVRAFAEAEAVLVVNPLTEAMVSPYSREVRVVTSGMDPARFPWPPPERPLRDGKQRILFAGLVEEQMKGFEVLREACALLRRKRQNFELVATADPCGRVDNFTVNVGWQSQASLPSVIWDCDILAVPTIAQEALGRTAVEAMAAGRPVVASRLGGLPFTVIDGATGLLAEPGDPADLARKLEILMDDVGLRERMGRAGRRRFEEHYAWPVIVERHYRPLLQARHKSRRT